MATIERGVSVEGNTDKWCQFLPKLVGFVDAVAIILSMITAQLVRFGADSHAQLTSGQFDPNYWMISLVLTVVWWLAIGSSGSRNIRVLGTGIEEYKDVTRATVYFFGGIAIFSYAFQLSTARGYVGIALPVGIVLLVIGRWAVSKWVRKNRRVGNFTRNVLILGSPSAAEHLYERLESSPEAGYRATAAALPGFSFNSPTGDELPIPVITVSSHVSEIVTAIDGNDIDVVAISAGSNIKPRKIRELGWELQARSISMVMAPALTDIAGPRIHTQPVAGLPLIHVSTPKLVGIQAGLKRGFDIIGATLAILLLSPVFLVVRFGSS